MITITITVQNEFQKEEILGALDDADLKFGYEVQVEETRPYADPEEE